MIRSYRWKVLSVNSFNLASFLQGKIRCVNKIPSDLRIISVNSNGAGIFGIVVESIEFESLFEGSVVPRWDLEFVVVE